MPTSQEVFTLRRNGSLDEAYSMALEIIEEDPHNEWNIKALIWCLYDLTKRAVSANDYSLARTYIDRIDSLSIENLDEILINSIDRIKIQAIPEKRIILQAKEKSKEGNHQEALTLFSQAIQLFPDDIDLNNQYAWELQKEGKLIFNTDRVDIYQAKQLLANYIKLKNSRPSLLHSLFLKFADKIKDREEFNLIAFLKLWDLNNLTDNDFEPYLKDDKSFPSNAERIIQHGAKLILDKSLTHEIDFFLPFINFGISRFKDNIWLPYYKSKLLHLVNRNEEAIEFLIPVVKEKSSDYWTWSLLAELLIEADREKALSCYCKALLCKSEAKFLANVRIKLAEILIHIGSWEEAKVEITLAIDAKEAEGLKIPDRIRGYQQNDWYKNAINKSNNNDFYILHKQVAEEFIFHSLPWFDSCLGEKFILADKPDKPRRKLFIKLPKEIIEVTISDRRFNTTRNFREGDSIRIKGEFDKEKAFKVHLLEKRDSTENWDLFEWHNGNVVQAIKDEQGGVSSWRISVIYGKKMKEGIIDNQTFRTRFQIKEGLPVFVKFYQKELPRPTILSLVKESKINILSIKGRHQGHLWDSFPEQIGIVDHINNEKGIAHFIINKQIDGIIRLNQLKEKIEVGTLLSVRLKKIIKDREHYYTVLTCCVTTDNPSENLIKSFKGLVKSSGSIGFVDDVFIESSFFLEQGIKDSNYVYGKAIISYNKKKGTWGWKAIEINLYV